MDEITDPYLISGTLCWPLVPETLAAFHPMGLVSLLWYLYVAMDVYFIYNSF